MWKPCSPGAGTALVAPSVVLPFTSLDLLFIAAFGAVLVVVGLLIGRMIARAPRPNRVHGRPALRLVVAPPAEPDEAQTDSNIVELPRPAIAEVLAPAVGALVVEREP